MRSSLVKGGIRHAVLPCLVLLACLMAAGVTHAQQTAPAKPAAPPLPTAVAPAQVTPPLAPASAPSASQLAAARELVIASGMSRSFYIVIPQFMDQLGTALTQTRPDLIRDLNATMEKLKPEFDKQADEMIDLAAHIYVRLMTEDEMKQAAAFFNSPAGQKYVGTQPAFMTDALSAMQGWQAKISANMTTRVREEMRKKGHVL